MTKRVKIPTEIRRLIYDLYARRCARCCVDEDLQIHHVDRDPSNNNIENLELICVWCHIDEHPNNEQEMLDWFMKQKEQDIFEKKLKFRGKKVERD